MKNLVRFVFALAALFAVSFASSDASAQNRIKCDNVNAAVVANESDLVKVTFPLKGNSQMVLFVQMDPKLARKGGSVVDVGACSSNDVGIITGYQVRVEDGVAYIPRPEGDRVQLNGCVTDRSNGKRLCVVGAIVKSAEYAELRIQQEPKF